MSWITKKKSVLRLILTTTEKKTILTYLFLRGDNLMRQKEKRPYKFLALAAGLVGILLVLEVPGPADESIPLAVKEVLEGARLSEVAGLKACNYGQARLMQENIYRAFWEYCSDPQLPERSHVLRVNFYFFIHVTKTEEEWYELSQQDKDIFLRPILRIHSVDGYPNVIVSESSDELVGGFWQDSVYVVLHIAGEAIANYSTYDEVFREVYRALDEHRPSFRLKEKPEEAEPKRQKKIVKEIPEKKLEGVPPYHITVSSQHILTVKKGKAEPLGQIWIENNASVAVEDVVVTFSPNKNWRIAFVDPAQRTAYVGKILPGEAKQVFDFLPPLIRGMVEGKDSLRYTIKASNLARPLEREMNFEVVSISTYGESRKEPLEGLPPGVVGWKLTKDQLPQTIQLAIPQETYTGGFELEFSQWGAEVSRIPALLSGFWKVLGMVDALRENGFATAIKGMAVEQGLKKLSPGIAQIYAGSKLLLQFASGSVNTIDIGSQAGQEIANYFDKSIGPAYRFHELVDRGALSPLRVIAVKIHGWNKQTQRFESGLRFFFLNGAASWEEYANSMVYIEIDLCQIPQDVAGLNLKVNPYPVYVAPGEITILEISLENLYSSERKEINIYGNIEDGYGSRVAEVPLGSFCFFVESLNQSEVWTSPTPIGITGLERGSAKLAIEITESGKRALQWEIPVVVE
jgi:hypothetical protein